jgi:hypothetical protein
MNIRANPQSENCVVSDADLDRLRNLVQAYLDAYSARMAPPKEGQDRELWAAYPLSEEYRHVLAFVRSIAGVAHRYNDATTEGFTDTVLRAALADPKALEHELRGLATTLEHDLRTKLYVPIDGIILDAPRYSIGALSLVEMNDANYAALIDIPDQEILRENPLYGDEQREGFARLHRDRTAPLKGRICVEIPTDLDIPKTFEFAVAEAIDSLCDFLQFGASVSAPPDSKRMIAWATTVPSAWRIAYAISDGPAKSSRTHAEATAPSFPFLVSEQIIKGLVDLGLERIANLVGRDATNEFDDMLKRAIRWFAKGERERHIDDRKLSYVTAVDLFFSKVGAGATARICKGFAFALAESDEHVPHLARYMLHVFGSRSETSHGGQLGIMEADAFRILRWRIQHLISNMAQQPFTRKSDVLRWISNRERNLSIEQRLALTYAVDWKSVQSEQRLETIAATLTLLVGSNKLEGNDVVPALETAREIANVLQNGGAVLRDLKPAMLEWSSALREIEQRVETNTTRDTDAKAYLEGVAHAFKEFNWPKPA